MPRTSLSFRRRALFAAALSLGLAGLADPAGAIDRMRIVAPANPGGGWDQTARTLQSAMQQEGIVPNVTVDNIPGAGGTIGLAQFVSRESGNGDALLVNGLVMVGAILTNDAAVTLEQVTPIARLTGEYEVIVVPANSEIETLAQLLEMFQADPGAVSWGGGSAGGTDHILAGLIAQEVGMSGADVNYVPFSGGGEALAAILGGHVTAGVSGYGEWAGQIEAGELRALAISSPERVEGIEIPTLIEQGVAVDLANWRAVVAPPDLSDEERSALIDAVTQTARSGTWQQTLEERNWMDLFMAGDAFQSYLEGEQVRVRKILTEIGLVQ
jgi:putative tricarboxylic transport membrane protein